MKRITLLFLLDILGFAFFSCVLLGQNLDISCEVFFRNGNLLAKTPFFRPLLVRNELQIPHPVGTKLGEPFLMKGPLVFVGYGITAKDGTWDDYRGKNIEGSLAVVMTGVPLNDTSRFLLSDWDAFHKIENAIKHGARGVIFAGNPIRERLDNIAQLSFLRLKEKPSADVPVIVVSTSFLEQIFFLDYEQPVRDFTSHPSIPEAVLTVSEDEGKPFGPIELKVELKAFIAHRPLRNIESQHLMVYYYSGSLVDQNIVAFIETHERAYHDISRFCQMELDKKIICLSYPNWKMKWLLTGHLGYGWSTPNFIMEVNDGTSYIDPYHEMCHVFQRKLNPNYIGPFLEGMATLWRGWNGKDVHLLTIENMRRLTKPLRPFSAVLGDQRWREKPEYRGWEYAENGSISKYLIDSYGIYKYTEFFKMLRTDDYKTNSEALKKVYEKNEREIETKWKEFLRKIAGKEA